MQPLSRTLRERGYAYQFSAETLEEITDGQKRTLYLGVDPTADSMHVGQLQGILVLRRFIEDGHRLIILVGGGTGMVGDPGGKSEERNLLADEVIDANAEALRRQFSQLFGGVPVEMVNNAQWLRTVNLMEFLRDIGKHFTVNEMVKRDSVRPRLETPDASISFTEFSYMLLQAYDYLYLHQNHNCTLQVGGSDQWGNIISGVDLIRRKTGNAVYAFSWPLLLNKSTGKKFGKSEKGAVWLDAKRTSPFDFYQFWFNSEDDAVEEYLSKMTLLPMDEVQTAMEKHAESRGSRTAQKLLAYEVTKLTHGEATALNMQSLSEVLFGGQSISDTNAEVQKLLLENAPQYPVQKDMLMIDVLVQSGLASSKREARQFFEGGAVTLDGVLVEELTAVANIEFTNGIALLKRGKRSVVVLRLQ